MSSHHRLAATSFSSLLRASLYFFFDFSKNPSPAKNPSPVCAKKTTARDFAMNVSEVPPLTPKFNVDDAKESREQLRSFFSHRSEGTIVHSNFELGDGKGNLFKLTFFNAVVFFAHTGLAQRDCGAGPRGFREA